MCQTTVIQALRLGKLTALSKPDGAVRAIVDGRHHQKACRQNRSPRQVSESATAPNQFALLTKAGCECVAHILQSMTDVDPSATVISIDGVGAYDLISGNAMLEGLLRMEDGDQILPFVRCFSGSPSTYLWEDEMGVTQHIPKEEGGEQGNPLMPMLFALGQHGSLEAAQARLRVGERLMAFLDDIYAVCSPDRVGAVFAIVEQEMQARAHVRMHLGKTQVGTEEWCQMGLKSSLPQPGW